MLIQIMDKKVKELRGRQIPLVSGGTWTKTLGVPN